MPRIGNAERDRAIDALRGWYASGHLDDGELEDRIGRALSARTDVDLQALVSDLPVPVGKTLEDMFDPDKSWFPGLVTAWTGGLFACGVPVLTLSVFVHGLPWWAQLLNAACIILGAVMIVGGVGMLAGDESTPDPARQLIEDRLRGLEQRMTAREERRDPGLYRQLHQRVSELEKNERRRNA